MVSRRRSFPRRHIPFQEQADGTFQVNALGVDIGEVAEHAADLSKEKGRPVKFHFNGELVEVTEDSTADQVVEWWHRHLAAKTEARMRTPEYMAEQARRVQEIIGRQHRHDQLMVQLRQMPKGDHAAILRWTVSYEEAAGDIAVKTDLLSVVEHLNRLGYRGHANTIQDDATAAQKSALKDLLNANAEASADYIVGQVIACAEMGMTPHQILCTFVEEHFRRFGG